jgi:hypothetical protein
MKYLLLIFIGAMLLSCNNEADTSTGEDTMTTVQPDTMVNDNTVNRDTAPALSAPRGGSAVPGDTLKK